MAKRLMWAAVVLAGCCSSHHSVTGVAEKSFDFEKERAGATPAGFAVARTGGEAEGSWVVQEDASSGPGKKVLTRLTADKTSACYPLFVYDGLSARDVKVSVRFKAISGEVDQAGGLVARYRDRDNYYVVRANALEDNVRLYKVVAGKRVQFAGVDVKVAPAQWHSLALEVKGSHFEVWMDGKSLFQAEDTAFTAAGLAGLWTKADSVTSFDDLIIRPLD